MPGSVMTLKHNRAYRFVRAGVTVLAAVVRYLTLKVRRHLPGLRPTERSWDRAHAKTGRAIHRLATGMGGAFVKLGQVLGARADVMPPSLIEPLPLDSIAVTTTSSTYTEVLTATEPFCISTIVVGSGLHTEMGLARIEREAEPRSRRPRRRSGASSTGSGGAW